MHNVSFNSRATAEMDICDTRSSNLFLAVAAAVASTNIEYVGRRVKREGEGREGEKWWLRTTLKCIGPVAIHFI